MKSSNRISRIAALAALIAVPAMAGGKTSQAVTPTATRAVTPTACFEHGGEHVRLVDAEGKRHRYTVFPLADSTDSELADFEKSRKVVAMDENSVLWVKQGKDGQGEPLYRKIGPIAECPVRKASFPKL